MAIKKTSKKGNRGKKIMRLAIVGAASLAVSYTHDYLATQDFMQPEANADGSTPKINVKRVGAQALTAIAGATTNVMMQNEIAEAIGEGIFVGSLKPIGDEVKAGLKAGLKGLGSTDNSGGYISMYKAPMSGIDKSVIAGDGKAVMV